MSGFLDILVQIFRQPSILVALIALLGLALQRKGPSDMMKGTIKTFVGFLVLSAGASVIVASLTPFGTMFTEVFRLFPIQGGSRGGASVLG
ncbi:PTS transporter subunit IIC, partial [Actinomyces radicidentis]|uniref:PTS transporter subunit IIC n=1 Tax=Actinomyces radicidentis TaxID=111015 RepID=UPI0026DF0800